MTELHTHPEPNIVLEANEHPHRRRRLKRTGMILFIAMGATVLGRASFALAHYSPLRGCGGGPSVGATVGGDPATVFKYKDQGRVRVQIILCNDSRFGVTVSSVNLGSDTESHSLFQPLSVLLGPDGAPCCADTRFMAFHPFALHAHEMRTVYIEAILHDCEYYPGGGGGYGTYPQQSVSFRVAGLPRTQDVELTTPYGVENPSPRQCPRPRSG